MDNKGTFIVIDGTDGAGKSTQLRLLQRRLKQASVPVANIHFPQHGKPSAYFIDQYLNGKYGDVESGGINVYAASLLYALDRFDAGQMIQKKMSAGMAVFADRYVSSNMGHQGAKIRDDKERKKYFQWIDHIEFALFKIPRPTLTIILHVPAKAAAALIEKKGARAYVGGIKKDIHERNVEHLRRAERAYLEIARLFPEQYRVIECAENGRLLSVDEIHERIWFVIAPLLSLNPEP